MKKLGFITLLFSLVSCMETVVNKKDTNDTTSNPVSTTTGGSTTSGTTTGDSTTGGTTTGGTTTGGTDTGSDDGEGVISYHRLNSPALTMHGKTFYENMPSRRGPNNEIIMWSSVTDMNGVNESIFMTDSRFNMRLIARNTGATVDSQGNSCAFTWQPFQKLQVEVRIRRSGSSYGYNHVFELDLDTPSKVKEFTTPLNNTDPLVVEILRVRWDYTCQYYANQGYPNYPGYCPWDEVWKNDCVAVEMHVATDYTSDIVGERYE